MKKLYCKRKYSISLIIVFSLFIQLFVPFFSIDANAVGSDEQRRNENGVILPAEEEIISDESDEEEIVTEEEVEKEPVAKVVQVEARNSGSGFKSLDQNYDESTGDLVGLDTIEPAEEEIISDESDEEEIVTEEEVEKEPVAKVVQVEARNSGSGFSSLTPIYNESTGEFEIRFQYDLEKVQPGDEFTVDIDSTYIDLEELQDGVNYTVIKDGSTYKIKFKDEFSGANQGIISIKTQTKEVDKSDEYKIEWKLDDESLSETIFIKKPGDSKSDIREEKSSKNVQSYIWDLGNKIKGEVNEDGEQSITVEDDITSVKIPYTLVYETTTGGNLNIKDELDDLLTYNKGSFTAKLESWDSNGWNKETTDNVDLSDYLTFDGNTFSIEGYELPPNSRITINYNANVKDAEALETHLNQLLENEELDGKEGSVSYVFNNKAKINDDDRDGNYSGNVNVPGEKPEVKPEYPSNVLEKYVDPTTANATFDNEGKLIPIPVTYTLKLNMSKFNGDNIKQLTENLVLTDNLDPNHKVEFELSDVTITSNGGVTVKEGNVDETDDTIGNYTIDNKQFKFNAGKEPADYTIILKGNITALNNQKDYWSPLPFFDYYSYENTAVAKAGKDLIGKGKATTTVIDKKGQTTVNNENVFKKEHKTNPETPVMGQPIKVTYIFTVNDWNAGSNAVDVSKSTITDIIDPIFDTSKGYEVKLLNDTWHGQNAKYVLSSLDDGVLTINFDEKMPENLKKSRWQISIELTTFPITEQSQALIRNSASLTGSDSGLDYSSSTETSGQTTGGELLVRKTVTDLDNIDYRKNYTLELDSDGNPKHKEFNYKIDLIPQVDFRNVKILPLTDVLPEALEFVGLIASWESDTATVNRTTEDYANTGGKVEVTYENGELKIANNTSTFGSGSISIRFRVKLKDSTSLKAGDIISNVITSQDPPANITVVEPGKYPINITKVDSETGERIEDKNQVARFKLEKVGEDGTKTTVYNEIRIVSGQLVDAQGKALVVESIGNYLLTETKAPTGYILSEEPISIRVTENGTIPEAIVVQNTKGEEPEPEPETTTHTVVKEWEVEEGSVTPSVEVTLYNGENIADVEDAKVELNSTNGYTYTWEDLPADGVYAVVEKESEEYEQVSNTISEDGLTTTITNKLVEPEPETTTHTVVKEWEVEEGSVTPSVEVTLYNGENIADVEDAKVELNSTNGYTYTWEDLPADGVYAVVEKESEEYEQVSNTISEDGLTTTITNKLVEPEPETTTHTVVKEWEVEEGAETPAVEVTLYNGENKADVKDATVELNSTNGYTYTWEDLPADGVYAVVEKESEEYEQVSNTISEDGLTTTITNKLVEPEPETTTHTVVKEWEVEEGSVTPSVEVTLYNGENIADVEDAKVELNSTNGYTYTWEDLPADGVYAVVEKESEEYEQVSNTISEDGLTTTITNKLVEPEPETTTHTVVKEWEVEEGSVTPSVEVTLYNGENIADVEDAKVELNSTNGYTYTWEDLPADGVYAVVEKESEEYEQVSNTISEDGLTTTITNKLVEPEPETTEISVEKKWIGTEGENITVNLLANGKKVKNVVLSSANNWKHTFTDLPTVDDVTGEAINYTVEEVEMEGYESSIAGSADLGFVITNTEKTSVDVEKKWIGTEGENITVNLLANGEKVKDVVLSSANNWKHTFTDLPTVNDVTGEAINYTVEEVEMEGYESSIAGSADLGFVITNTEKTSVDVEKKWIGTEGENITVNLLANEEKIKDVVLSSANNWKHTFTDLPTVDDVTGEAINYTVEEVEMEGYESSIAGSADLGFVITNTEKTSVDVEKKWIGTEGENITVNLLANGKKIKDVVLSSANNWKHTFTDLPTVNDVTGEAINYTVEEVEIEGYESSIAGSADLGFVITNTEKTSVEGTKTWEDNNDQDGMRPESITIRLLKNGTEIASKTVTEADGWAWSFTDLPKYEAGELITYTITEDTVSEYSSAVSGYNVTNTHTPGKTSVQVTKAWADGNNQDGVRPESVTIKLLADGVDTGKTLVLTATNNWTDTFTDLDEYKAGTKIVYTIEELTLGSGYTSVITGDAATGFEVTNTKTPEVVDVSGTKTWEDNNDQDGMRPESITIRLLKNGTEIASKTVTEADGWAWSFTDLPKYEAGELITYTITEDTVSEYSSAVSGYNVTNTHTPGKTSVQVTKAWADGNNQDGVRPESVTIKLLADGVDTGKTLVLTATNNWTDTFTDLDEYKAGTKIVYTIEELTLGSGYTSVITGDAATGFEVTNTKTPEVVDVSGTKTWEDNNDQDGMRPESITIRLLKNGTEIASKTVTEADGWAWSFTDLPKYEAGELITYTITEDTVSEYSSAVSGYNVTNTHTPGKTSVQVTKAWADGNNQDGVRPESVTIKLLADGVDTGKTLVLTATNNWTDTFTDLDEYKAGTKIVYTIEELTLGSGYTSVITGDAATGFEVTNTKTPEVVDVSGTKTWEDNNDQDGMRPESITIRLLKNGTEIASKTVTEADGWAWSFTDLPKYEAGELITYTITEDTVSEYSSAVSGYNVTNTHTPGKTSVQVTKAWADGNNQDGVRPESVTIKLLADGVDTGKTLVLTATNNWTDTFTDLDEYKAGTKIVYTIEELTLGSGYTSVITGDAATGFEVTNTKTPEVVDVSGTKTWEDNNDQDGMRPESITIRLLKNGTEIASKTVTEADGWAWSFTDLPKYEAGELITYTITEDTVSEYSSAVSGYNVTNTHTPGKTSVQVTKAWADGNNQDGVRPESVTIKLLADGVDTGKTLVLTATNNWTDTFTDLDEYKAGTKIVYTIEEVAVGNGYTSAVTGNAETGFTVTNSYTPPTEPTEPTTPTEPTEPTTPTEPTKPTTPTEPTKPTTPTEPTKPTGPTELPKTGEDSGPYLWLSLMCMSVGALLLLFRRKTKIQND